MTALESAIGDLDEAMQPSTPVVESVRLLESASLGICDVVDRIEEYLPEAEATLTLSLRGRGRRPYGCCGWRGRRPDAGWAAPPGRLLAGVRRDTR